MKTCNTENPSHWKKFSDVAIAGTRMHDLRVLDHCSTTWATKPRWEQRVNESQFFWMAWIFSVYCLRLVPRKNPTLVLLLSFLPKLYLSLCFPFCAVRRICTLPLSSPPVYLIHYTSHAKFMIMQSTYAQTLGVKFNFGFSSSISFSVLVSSLPQFLFNVTAHKPVDENSTFFIFQDRFDVKQLNHFIFFRWTGSVYCHDRILHLLILHFISFSFISLRINTK